MAIPSETRQKSSDPTTRPEEVVKNSEEVIENLPKEQPASLRAAELHDAEDKLAALERAELSVDAAFATGKAERSRITRAAQLDAAEAVAMVGIAMESDEAADEAYKLNVIARHSANPEAAKRARRRMREANSEAKRNHKAATRSAKNAYDAIRFSAPNTLGFMRALQVIFAIRIAYTILLLLLTSRDVVVYDSANFLSWAMVVLDGVAFWFFINRYKIARPFVIGVAAIGIGVTAIEQFMQGTFDILPFVFNNAFYFLLLFYFIFSKRVKATMVNNLAKRTGIYDKEGTAYLEKGWPLVRNLIIYFIVFSVMGHWMEAGMCQFIRLGLVQGEYDPTNTMLWRDWFYPYPMEGAAVVLIALFLYPFFEFLKRKIKNPILPYVISFFANAFVCSCIEFSMGLIVNADLQLWDYTNNFGNIMGQVCLQNAMAFGAASSIIAWWVYPLLQRWISRVPDAVMNISFVVIAAIGGILWSLYLFDPPKSIEVVPEEQLTLQEQEVDTAAVSLDFLQAALDSLEESVSSADSLDQSAINDQMNNIQTQINEIAQEIEAQGGDNASDTASLLAPVAAPTS